MHAPSFNPDPALPRLRSVMLGTMGVGVLVALLGQPGTYWQRPETMRDINHVFGYFLARGWQVYLLANLAYVAAAFGLVSVLPRKAGLVTAFCLVLGHFFAASNWLAIRWHLGMKAPIFYGAVLGALVAVGVIGRSPVPAGEIVRRLRWVMLGAMVFDCINTYLGQPASYWQHPETVNESNGFFRWFLFQGWPSYLLISAVYYTGAFFLVSRLPAKAALVCVCACIFGHFAGGSNWFFFRWNLGMGAPVAYGLLLSLAVVGLALPGPSRLAGKSGTG